MDVTTYYLITVILNISIAIVTIIGVIIAIKKLGIVYKERQVINKREIKWKTEAAYNHYISDGVFNTALERIFKKSKKGTDYRKYELDHDVIFLVNYLESIAVGVKQGIYNELMMKDYLNEAVYKSVKVFILGESGNLHGRSWKADKSIVKLSEQPFLTELYTKWFPNEKKINYEDH